VSRLSLRQACGLAIDLDGETFQLTFGGGLTAPKGAIRDIGQMQEVLLAAGLNTPQELYYMYRDVRLLKDEELLKKYNLRYDVTVIKPDRLGRELMKTAGHYHPGNFGELYEVVAGKAFCMLQKANRGDYRIIEDVILVEASVGQKIVIPPGYGHILINPGSQALVTSNWVSSRFSSEYDLYKRAKGAAYFVIINNINKIEYLKNDSFKELAPIRFAQPAKALDKFGLKEGSPIYPIIDTGAQRLDFLNHPDKYDYSDIFVFKK